MKVSPFQFGRLLKLHLLLTIPSPESRLGSDFTFPPQERGSSRRLYRRYQRSLQAPPAPRTTPRKQHTTPGNENNLPPWIQHLNKLLRPHSGAGKHRFPPTAPQLLPAGCSDGTGSAPALSPELPRGTAGSAPSPGSDPSTAAEGAFGHSFCVNRK